LWFRIKRWSRKCQSELAKIANHALELTRKRQVRRLADHHTTTDDALAFARNGTLAAFDEYDKATTAIHQCTAR